MNYRQISMKANLKIIPEHLPHLSSEFSMEGIILYNGLGIGAGMLKSARDAESYLAISNRPVSNESLSQGAWGGFRGALNRHHAESNFQGFMLTKKNTKK